MGPQNIFHVLMLKKCHRDPSHIILHRRLPVCSDMSYLEYPVKIIDWQEKVTRNKIIPIVKVIWQYHSLEDATWELEDEIQDKYAKLFKKI